MTHHLPTLELEIKSLLEHSVRAPSREHVEYTLTSGYAHALRLESERLQAETRLRSLVRNGAPQGMELADASVELDRVSEELARLRALLANLRAHAL